MNPADSLPLPPSPPGGLLPVRLRVNGLPTGLTPAEFTVGSVYAVTGILTQFNGTAQLKLRFRTDVTP